MAVSDFDLESLGIKPISTWGIFHVSSHPGSRATVMFLHLNIIFSGLIFIKNPFNKLGIEYWVTQAFEKYCQQPNPTNVKEAFDPLESSNEFFFQKLRWATLGYHHNWDTKVRKKCQKHYKLQ